MLFKLFKKDSGHFQERGDRLFAENRFAEARHEYEEALHRLNEGTADAAEQKRYLQQQLRAAGNGLAQLNLVEAEHAMQLGDQQKAQEHVDLALVQADDETIRGNARQLLSRMVQKEPQTPSIPMKNHSCSGCGSTHDQLSQDAEAPIDFLSLNDRFELLIHPLPGDLPDRYRQLGEEFAYAYTAVHDGRVAEGLEIFHKLSAQGENDILNYEVALITFQEGRFKECESLLRRALSLNPQNALCLLTLVQLVIETGRVPEAVPILEGMIADGHLPDQASLMLADVRMALGQTDAALDQCLQALGYPSAARAAAERAIPILESMGRGGDAQALAKRYLKGCC